jgi:hypothetical protein
MFKLFCKYVLVFFSLIHFFFFWNVYFFLSTAGAVAVDGLFSIILLHFELPIEFMAFFDNSSNDTYKRLYNHYITFEEHISDDTKLQRVELTMFECHFIFNLFNYIYSFPLFVIYLLSYAIAISFFIILPCLFIHFILFHIFIVFLIHFFIIFYTVTLLIRL